jgi:hypothetical protein
MKRHCWSSNLWFNLSLPINEEKAFDTELKIFSINLWRLIGTPVEIKTLIDLAEPFLVGNNFV